MNADADGDFVLEAPPGNYSVGASSPHRVVMRFEADATVVAGQDVRVEVHVGAADDGGSGWGPMASVARGELGASFENVNGSVQVSWVVADSPLSAAGLRVGDVLTAIDGKPVGSALDAFARSRGVPGSAVAIAWLREGVPHAVTISRAP